VCIADDSFTGYGKSSELSSARDKLYKMSTVESGGLPFLLNLASESPYMLTSNVDVADGLVNGAIGGTDKVFVVIFFP
jgi:hypothetical protein